MSKLFFIIILILSAEISFAKDNCSTADKVTEGLQDTVQQIIFKNPACSGLSNILKNRDKLLNDAIAKRNVLKNSQKFENEFIKCHDDLYKKCYKNQKPIREVALNEMFLEWKKDPHLNMTSPEAMCTQRAVILSEKLASQGYDVQMVKFESSTLVGIYKRNDILKKEQYAPPTREGLGFHYAVSVMVELPNGKLEKRILDPQFFDKPETLKDFSQFLTGSECVDKPSRATQCRVEFKRPTVFNYLDVDDYVYFLNGKLRVTEPCGWTFLAPSKFEIDNFNSQNSFHTGNPKVLSPEELKTKEEMSREENLKILQEKLNIELRNLSQSEAIGNDHDIKKTRKMIQDLQHEIRIRQNT